MELYKLTAHKLHELLKKKEVSSLEITESVFKRIEAVEKKVHSYVTLMKDIAIKQAKNADKVIHKNSNLNPLTGIPIAIKDNMCIEGTLATCSSKILYNFNPPYDATVVRKLKEANAVFVGKTNMDEFAMGSSTENSGFFTTLNPWDLERIPGGSSGGSAAAVAADEAIMALGSDTGGSIRQPASLCGVVGLKPTYGRISRYGLVAFASSLDQIGPLCKDVTDAALLTNIISGYDKCDSTSLNYEVPDFTKVLGNDIKGLKIGYPKEYFIEGIDREVKASMEAGLKKLEDLGAEVFEVSLPHTQYAVAVYYIIATAEASSNLARYDGAHYGYRTKDTDNIVDMFSKSRAEGFGREVKRRIMLGTYVLSSGYFDAYYLKALKVRTLIKNDFDKAFEKCDVIITPTSPTPAFKVGEKMQDPLQMYLSDIFTISINLAGIPGISIPCGFTGDNLPIGMQLLAKPLDEEKIFQVAYAFEQATDYYTKKPVID